MCTINNHDQKLVFIKLKDGIVDTSSVHFSGSKCTLPTLRTLLHSILLTYFATK